MLTFRLLVSCMAFAAPLSTAAAETGALVRFITCPIYRDTDSGKKSGCWLADDPATGMRYDISLSPYRPDWNFATLVEGRLSDAPSSPCGSPVLDAVRSSRLYDMPCTRHMLPAEGYPGRRFKLPQRNITPLSVPRTPPTGPFSNRTFSVYFEFGQSFLVYQYSDYLLDKAAEWMKAAHPRKVIVTGFAATRPDAISGHVLREPASLAHQRAETIAESLRRLLPDLSVETKATTSGASANDKDADGIPGQSQRRAEVQAIF